ncbi:hypothetical protein BEL04_05495 [Mucilaginibacter sp. PPCGB 2223]|uniref:hypothetical protein n=1 Tax=Mucilaginibacter sp. PPCGB 2223 TaxID=1886027 RepID=UPI000825E940|nr:hypothetical protein [Mucilaginibacter sp. PPCGB 2223]OCX53743.1 hypothetical protein BEL04_05495 [Mucilaginibacter sp. PPCGB 2223]
MAVNAAKITRSENDQNNSQAGKGGLSIPAVPVLKQIVQPVSRVAPVQRAITRGTWDTLIEPNLTDSVGARLTGGTASLVIRNSAGAIKQRIGTVFSNIADLTVFLAAHDWNSKLVHVTGTAEDVNRNEIDFSVPGALNSNIPGGGGAVPLNVEEVAGDRHSFIHHSYSMYSTPGAGGGARERREAGHHLTVENAHLLGMLALQGDGTLGHTDKTTLTKPDVNTQLGARGVTEVDNLNFFPRATAQAPRALGLSTATLPTARLPEEAADQGAEAVDEQLSLAEYLAFIQRSLASLDNVPAVYGAKILHSARVMQTRTGLDPAALFLKVGKGDQRQMVRVVLTMAHKGLAEGLVLPAEMLALFERYITNTPALPFATPVAPDTEWVAKGALAADGTTTYNALETRYVDANYAAIVTAMKAYVALP